MSRRSPKTPKAKKPKAPAAEAAAAPEVAAAAAAPAEAAAPERKEITAKELLGEELGEVKVRRAKGSKNITTGICHILATFNNTKVTITDANGNVICVEQRRPSPVPRFPQVHRLRRPGRLLRSRQARPSAHGLKDVSVRVKGPGMGRDSAIRALQVLGLNVTSILDTTPIPHNGCRPPKRRRVVIVPAFRITVRLWQTGRVLPSATSTKS
jgi:small subunit ribosomal protein S11